LEQKNYSNNRKVSIQESSNESEIEIEFESDDSGERKRWRCRMLILHRTFLAQ